MYISYSRYLELGGKVAQSDFPTLERQARAKLDIFTLDRLKAATTIIPEVEEVMTEFINRLSSAVFDGKIVTSYSNGIESYSYKESSLNDELEQIATEYLPIELISIYRGC